MAVLNHVLMPACLNVRSAWGALSRTIVGEVYASLLDQFRIYKFCSGGDFRKRPYLSLLAGSLAGNLTFIELTIHARI
jgi:hypothetical protein